MMPFCQQVQLEVPDSFPQSEFDAFDLAGRKIVLPTPSAVEAGPFREFALAESAVVFRYLGCVEAMDLLEETWMQEAGHLSFEGHYRLERNLFAFFTNGVSSVECLSYACYVLATQVRPNDLPFTDMKARRQIDPKKLGEKMSKLMPGIPMDVEFDALLKSAEWQGWNNYRNLLFHRSSLPRIAKANDPSPPMMLDYDKTWSVDALFTDEKGLRDYVGWLSDRIKRLLVAGIDFCFKAGTE
jgi:hypothetical protein